MQSLYLKIVTLAALISLSCTTKVSEWILVNSIPDRYLLVYYHNGPVSEQDRQQNSNLENSIKTANIIFKPVLKKDIRQPYYALYYNNHLFSEYPDYKSVQNIADSRVREKITTELKAGKLCVMLYLKSGNKGKDDTGLQHLKNSLASSPFGRIISVVELDKGNLDEQHFVSMLLNVESDLKSIQEPMLFGVFGRFRVLEPLVGKGISEANINLMIDFFTADCSCVIKDDLPGISILSGANWDNPSPALVNGIMDKNPNLEHH
ncbi:MAG TPA: hypothetical protein VN249_06060 [Prolixibacteraceae bacterium]|nr:hypothetical protein [Prolixibacteraceae bacterium]